MNSIRSERVALDTNVYIHALLRTPGQEDCAALFFDFISDLSVHIPLQVIVELQHNLSPEEQTELIGALHESERIAWNYTPASTASVDHFRSLGAREGDAHIAAQLEEAGIGWLISENRQFLTEIRPLPLQVLNARQTLDLLGQ